MKTTSLFVATLACVLATPSFGQQKVFNWVTGNDETVSLDPGYYHAGPTFQQGARAKDVHVDIEAQRAVTIAMVSAQEWSDSAQHPEAIKDLKYTCAQEHIVRATYSCALPAALPMVIVVRDERISERGAFAGIGEVITHHDHDGRDADRAISAGLEAAFAGRRMREFTAPNYVHIQYYDWSCTENCNLPDPPQPKLFDWVPSDNETVRLDPANYYTSRTYNPGPYGANMQVEIEAQRPVTIAMVDPAAWTAATEHPNASQNLNNIEYLCVQPHVVKATYVCKLPGFWPKLLIVRDERNATQDARDGDHTQGKDSHDGNGVAHVIPASASGAVVSGRDLPRQFSFPNDIRIQYYSWRCVQSCDQPDFGWVRQVQEKYPLTSILKVYGGITPDHNGAQVSIKVKSPVPMAVAILPSTIAAQLYGKPDMFESAVASSTCQQRGVQSSTFQCTLNLADGAQSLVLLPEAGTNIPNRKKTEIEVQVVKCIDNCANLPAK
jgi:hypothetical protein